MVLFIKPWGKDGDKSKIANTTRDSESPAPSVSWLGLNGGQRKWGCRDKDRR